MISREDLKNKLREEQSSEIKPLYPDFFKEIENYIQEIDDEIREIGNPYAIESKLLEDELQSALTDIDIIFMRRVKKVTSLATSRAFAQSHTAVPTQSLTEDEKELYNLIYNSIKNMQSKIIDPIHDPSKK